MTQHKPVFRSPLTLPVPASSAAGAALSLTDLTGAPAILIQGEASEALQARFARVPARPGDLVPVGAGLLARLTPIESYLFGLSPAADLPSAAVLDGDFVQANRFAHATDYTHGRAILRLVGTAARDVLSKICGVDFHETTFPNQRVAQTSAAKIKMLIARYDEGEMPAYVLHVSRPLGQYFWEIVWDAGQEFGVVCRIVE